MIDRGMLYTRKIVDKEYVYINKPHEMIGRAGAGAGAGAGIGTD